MDKTKQRINFAFEHIKTYCIIAVGSVITALAINIFLVPNKIASGGVSGVATVLFYLSGGKLPVGITMLAINIPLFIAGMKFIGKKFILKSIVGSIFLSVVIDITKPLCSYFVDNYFNLEESAAYTADLTLYSIFGGFIMGIGLGLVLKTGATTGGSDLMAMIVTNFLTSFTVGKVLLFIDASVIIFAAIAFNSVLLGMYAILTLYISSKVIDAMLEGINYAKAVFIISNDSELISNKILTELDRGVTALKGTGMYTGEDKNVLLCVVHRRQLARLKECVREIDAKAFIILTDVREVLGEGFKTYD